MTIKRTIVSLLSGGLDSATATALAREAGYHIIGLSFDYGQRHKRELESAKEIANYFVLEKYYTISVNLSDWGGSVLTSKDEDILRDDVISSNTIPPTYVPGRNTVFIALGLSLAEAVGAQRVMLGVNEVDYSGYPDCRPDYLEAFQSLANLATKIGREGKGTQLWAPLVRWSKTRIIQEALRLEVPINATWSCYNGGEQPCGICASCCIRNNALKEVGRVDLCR
ncbi:Queuosine Biosynthesis QueC ATPase (chromatophore) [Paulinella micropora]|uniref:7-cyano-7-deazaguanine synthase n=1 Tax=Paulinella micropora TaxID=1928728 RepID=A0A1L5YBT0_9EUKA|nr:7-cyano-7-deazaguanine synthase [Paulinella micropora]AQX44935.1 7-cyano-7-deazaguanine synthase [Paulinella micropora]BBL86149.1 Queuosine Biosynthesis QueC ATPase [Paulinella micropora]